MYHIEFTRGAVKDLKDLPAHVRERVLARITELAEDPRPPASRKLEGHPPGFRRLRVGGYRAIYHLDEEERLVAVVRVGPGGTVYR